MSLLSGLVSYWKLDEASGNRADSFGTNTLTSNNTVSQVAGILNNAAGFVAASTQYLSIADNATLSMTGSFAISAWVYPTATQTGGLIGKDDGSTNREFRFYLQSDNTIEWTTWKSGPTVMADFASTATLTQSAWNHVVAYVDTRANQAGIIINNGTPKTASISGGSPWDGAAAFEIGRLGGGSFYFSGRIDEVAIWNRMLLLPEIDTLYNSGNAQPYPLAQNNIQNYMAVSAGNGMSVSEKVK